MPVTVIVGGQYGSEGKGKVAHCLAIERQATIAVRTGGPNAGHTVIDLPDRPVILRHLPTAAFIPGVKCVLAAGSYLSPEILLEEISRTGLGSDQLLIDPGATIITEEDKETERRSGLRDAIGSTQSGTGAALVRRIQRKAHLRPVESDSRLRQFVRPVKSFLRSQLAQSARVIVEGTQGFGLSPLHSPTYPYVTSRDTTAAAFVSEAGLSPVDVDEVVMVLRAFPIRVAGNSGPLPNEISWPIITKESGSAAPIIEYTSVTNAVRRVARFDPDIVRSAIEVNAPTHLVLNHLDYIDFSCRERHFPSEKVLKFLEWIESLISARIDYLGFDRSTLIKSPRALRKARSA
jgi:adenylosuccinate synthase